jgi:hypothetical protein
MGGFKKVETLEFCNTCHVNIARKEYTLPNVLSYLEGEVAAARNLKLVEVHSGKAADPAATKAAPGAVAMPEFWHLWAVRVAPEQVRRPAQLMRLNTLAKTVGAGKPIRVTIGGKPLDAFSYVPDPAKKDDPSAALDQDTRDRIMATKIDADWEYNTLEGHFAAHTKAIDNAILTTFATKHSLGVQQTLKDMGDAALAACGAIDSISFTLPNLHRIPFNLEPFGLKFEDDIFVATDQPYGLIKGTVERKRRD